MDQIKEKKNIWKRIGKITLKTVVFFLLFFLLIAGLILTPPVQQFITGKATAYLQKKLNTRVSVGKLYIGLPKTIVLQNIYLEDRQQDTLLYGGNIKIDIGLTDLILGRGVNVNSVALENITAKVKRQLPDTTFNFQFIIDAFASKEPKPEDKTDTTSTPVSVGSVTLNKIRVLYKDVVTGNDVEANLDHFDTEFDDVDLNKMKFGIGDTKLTGLYVKAYQTKPLKVEKPEIIENAEQKETSLPTIAVKEIDLQKIYLDYKNDVSAFYTLINLGQLKIKPERIDLAKQLVNLGDITLNNTNAAIHLGKTDTANITVKPSKEPAVSSNWKIQLASLKLDNNNIQFDNDNAPHQKSGMDYMHLKADDLTFHVNNFIYNNDSIAGKIEKGTFSEQSGFTLQQLQTDFLYSGKQAYLKNFYIKTPGTELKRGIAIQYESIEALQKNIGGLKLNVNMENSRIKVKDILTFVPSLRSQPAFADPDATWLLNGNIRGSVSNMLINNLQISGLRHTRVSVKGRITGLPDANKISANLQINNISSSKRDILTFVPASSLPAGITLPEKISLTGQLNGGIEKLTTDLKLTTNLGNALLKGNTQHITDAKRAVYDLRLQTQSLDLGTILQNKNNFGPVTADFIIKGNGYDTKTANASLEGKIKSAILKQYNYKDLNLSGSIAQQKAGIHASIADPNIHLSLNAAADLSSKYPALKIDGVIDSIKLKELHLSKDVIVYRGNISGDFASTNPDSLDGKLFILQSLLVHNQQRITMDSIQLVAVNTDTAQSIHFSSDILNADLRGKYKLTEMATVIQNAIEPYFSTDTSGVTKRLSPYDFTINAQVIDRPLLRIFIDSLQKLDTITIQSRFSDSLGWNALINAPAIKVGANAVNNLIIKADAGDSALSASINAAQIAVGNSISMYGTNLTADIAHDNIDFALNVKDKAQKSKYNVRGAFQQLQKNVYRFSLKPGNILLNYEDWDIPDENKIVLNSGDINAAGFVLDHSGEQLSINSLSAERNAPLEVAFKDFKIATLTGFAQQDSTLADGILNGKATVTNITSSPVFVGDLTIDNLSIKKDTVGNIKLLVDNKVKDTYNANVTITGNENDVSLSGNYFANTSSFDFLLDIRHLPMKTAQAFSGGAIRESSGYLNGKFNVAGTAAKPAVNGDLNFNNTAFNLSMLNNIFKIDQQKISVSSEGVRFNNFLVKDSAGNNLSVNGLAATSNFTNYNFDLDIRANNFRALNSTKKDNNLFYGQLYFDTRLKVKGTEAAPLIDGRLGINEKTKMTVVLPQSDPGVVDRQGIVVFADKSAPQNDSLFLASYDTLNTSSLQGMDISVNVTIDKKADFTLIIYEGNGDFLNVRGEAALNAGIDPGGNINFTGSYELEEGTYELTFNFLKRKFDIVKGSKIIWEGEPTEANVDITAKYTANTSPLDLVKNQLGNDVSGSERNTYLTRMPFDVMLKMSGKLLQPAISFDIILPEDKTIGVSNDIITTVNTKLEMMRQDDAEMNKQVFALLLLNRFVADDPFKSSSSTSASTMVKQSVSKLMTEELNRLAADLIKGVELNFDVESSDDYSTGERESRTDLNVGLSKRLLNDRLTVTVGSNFELEGAQNANQQATNIAGNVMLNYRLSEDGRYMLRGYRKNQYQGVIDGYVVETGIGFTITMDYNRFREIFENRKAAAERRKLIREKRKQEQQNSKTNVKGEE
ncbi:MAG: translocation/assembly module TamB [Chitinophagaceae bacterium]|nr:translocation/assembly module TamB [Chitinophagaceae bacterium]